MSKPTTTIWLPTDKVVPHPLNANRMSEEAMVKLRRNIESTKHYPPVVVRSLESSEQFADLHDEGKYQIIDGEHRWRIAVDRGEKQVKVDVWDGISDEQAETLLLTLNRLHGKDKPAKRAELIRRAVESAGGDVEAVAELLPEDARKIRASIEDIAANAVSQASEAASEVGKIQPVTFFMTRDQEEVVRGAIDAYLKQHDPDDLIESAREGAALRGVLSPADKKKLLRSCALAELCAEWMRKSDALIGGAA